MKVRLNLEQTQAIVALFGSNNSNEKNEKTLFSKSSGSRERPKILEVQYNPCRPAEAYYVTLKIVFKEGKKQIWYLLDVEPAEKPNIFRLEETTDAFKLHLNDRFFIFEKAFISDSNQRNIKTLFERCR